MGRAEIIAPGRTTKPKRRLSPIRAAANAAIISSNPHQDPSSNLWPRHARIESDKASGGAKIPAERSGSPDHTFHSVLSSGANPYSPNRNAVKESAAIAYGYSCFFIAALSISAPHSAPVHLRFQSLILLRA